MGHLWKTSQCDACMWDLMELTPPNTTAQLGHLEEARHYSEGGHLQHPLLLEDKVNFKRKSTKEHEQG